MCMNTKGSWPHCWSENTGDLIMQAIFQRCGHETFPSSKTVYRATPVPGIY